MGLLPRYITTFLVLFGLGLPSAAKMATGQDSVKKQKLFTDRVQPLVEQYCFDCHSGDSPEGDFDLAADKTADEVLESRAAWTKALQRIRFGDMPPPEDVELPSKERQRLESNLDELINQVDCTTTVRPGRVTIRRLNRNEYRNTIKSLIGSDYEPAADFPGDDVGYGFDNIGDVLTLPPILLEKYLAAAEWITKEAIVTRGLQPDVVRSISGNELIGDGRATNRNARVLTTNGTSRARITIPKSGQYELKVVVYGDQAGDEPVKINLINGRKKLRTSSVRATSDKPVTLTEKLRLQKGVRSFSIEFLNDYYNPKATDPNDRDRNFYIQSLTVRGPLDRKVNLPETHRTIFFVRPGQKIDGDRLSEAQAAERILTRLASRAFRRPVTDPEIDRLLKLVRLAEANGDNFETGIQLAVQAILVSPHFLFKVEQPTKPDEIRELNDYELATALSYFLWSSMPDDELFREAHSDRLQQSDRLQTQTRRMLKDVRSAELIRNFVGQWLQLRNLADTSIDKGLFPQFSPELAADMRKETELFCWDLLKRDGSVLELLDAESTFLNRRLAQHYGMDPPELKDVSDDRFLRVSLKNSRRGGLLTQGSILTVTSNPTRTSPVKRGRWVLENLLNEPPPPPAPNVMELEDQQELTGTLRERMQQHREDPSCASCHAQMDPLGFALENFDAIGRWREKDGSQPVDASGELPDGEAFRGARELQKLLVTRKRDKFLRCLVEKMLTFALGRGIEYYDRCAVDKIVERLRKNDFRFSELVIGIVESEPFRKRMGSGS